MAKWRRLWYLSKWPVWPITGDIAESHILGLALTALATLTERRIHFVLGNHDFYRGSVASTRRQVGYIISDDLVYLSQAGIVELTPGTALVGHDEWADGRLGDLDGSDVILNDFLLIDELKHWRDTDTLDKPALRRALEALGDEAAAYLKGVLKPEGGCRREEVLSQAPQKKLMARLRFRTNGLSQEH